VASRRCIHFYDRGLIWVFKHQFFTLMVTLATVAFTGVLIFIIPKGFFPNETRGVSWRVDGGAGTSRFRG